MLMDVLGGLALAAFFTPFVLLATGPVFILARKFGMAQPGWALLPVVHLYFLARMGDKSPWLLFLLLVPILGAVIHIYLWYHAYEQAYASPGWAFAYIIPLFGIIASWPVALGASPPTVDWTRV